MGKRVGLLQSSLRSIQEFGVAGYAKKGSEVCSYTVTGQPKEVELVTNMGRIHIRMQMQGDGRQKKKSL